MFFYVFKSSQEEIEVRKILHLTKGKPSPVRLNSKTRAEIPEDKNERSYKTYYHKYFIPLGKGVP